MYVLSNMMEGLFLHYTLVDVGNTIEFSMFQKLKKVADKVAVKHSSTVAQTTVPMFVCFSLKSITPNRI